MHKFYIIVLIIIVGVFNFSLQGICEVDSDFKLTYSDSIQNTDCWPKQSLKNRFQLYWKYRFNGDWQNAFKIEAPYFQEVVTKERYKVYTMHATKNTLFQVDITDIDKVSDYCYDIHCYLNIRFADGKTKRTYLPDRWIIFEGKWYHVIENPVFFPKLS